MNERIRELELQCFVYSEQTNKNIFDREKFAELLVRECVGIARQNNNSGEGGVIAQTIEQHFGVK